MEEEKSSKTLNIIFLIISNISIVIGVAFFIISIVFAFQNIDRTKLASVFLLCSTVIVVTSFICQAIITASYLNYKGKINNKNSYDDALTKMLNTYNEKKEN